MYWDTYCTYLSRWYVQILRLMKCNLMKEMSLFDTSLNVFVNKKMKMSLAESLLRKCYVRNISQQIYSQPISQSVQIKTYFFQPFPWLELLTRCDLQLRKV